MRTAVLQGAGVDKSEYAGLAAQLADRGHWVIVPNCTPMRRNYICPTASSASLTLGSLDADTQRDIRSALARGLLLFGHSAGGVAAFHALLDHLAGASRLPCPVVALASYGSGSPLETNATALPPVLFLSGEDDTVVPSRVTETAYGRLTGGIRTYIQLADLDHYSVTDSGLPDSAPPEAQPPSGSPDVSITLIATLVHAFSLAVMTDNRRWTDEISKETRTRFRHTLTGT